MIKIKTFNLFFLFSSLSKCGFEQKRKYRTLAQKWKESYLLILPIVFAW